MKTKVFGERYINNTTRQTMKYMRMKVIFCGGFFAFSLLMAALLQLGNSIPFIESLFRNNSGLGNVVGVFSAASMLIAIVGWFLWDIIAREISLR